MQTGFSATRKMALCFRQPGSPFPDWWLKLCRNTHQIGIWSEDNFLYCTAAHLLYLCPYHMFTNFFRLCVPRMFPVIKNPYNDFRYPISPTGCFIFLTLSEKIYIIFYARAIYDNYLNPLTVWYNKLPINSLKKRDLLQASHKSVNRQHYT